MFEPVAAASNQQLPAVGSTRSHETAQGLKLSAAAALLCPCALHLCICGCNCLVPEASLEAAYAAATATAAVVTVVVEVREECPSWTYDDDRTMARDVHFSPVSSLACMPPLYTSIQHLLIGSELFAAASLQGPFCNHRHRDTHHVKS